MIDLRHMVNRIKRIEDDLAKKPVIRWGVITSTSPLRVRYEEDSLPLLGSPSTLVHPSMLSVGQRVELLVQNGRPVIQGIGGGAGAGDSRIHPIPSSEYLNGWGFGSSPLQVRSNGNIAVLEGNFLARAGGPANAELWAPGTLPLPPERATGTRCGLITGTAPGTVSGYVSIAVRPDGSAVISDWAGVVNRTYWVNLTWFIA